MASYKLEYNLVVVDVNGDQAQVRIPTFAADTNTLAALATIMAVWVPDIQALTNGKIIRQGLTVLLNEAQYLVGTAPPTNAEYSSVTDGARLAFANGAGARTALTVPAPLESIFGANTNVVDSTNANVATLIADIAAHTLAPFGGAYNLYKGGVKTGRHSRKRVTHLIP